MYNGLYDISSTFNVYTSMNYQEKQLRRVELVYGKDSKEYKNIVMLMKKFNSKIDVIKPTS